MTLPKISIAQAGFAGVLMGAVIMLYVTPFLTAQEWWPGHSDHHHGTTSEYHTHADFLIVLNDEVLDLSGPEFMSTAERILAPDVHLHDGDGSVVHYHAPDITFASFLDSIGIELTNSCLTTASKTVCRDETNDVILFVNEQRYNDDITSYVSTDLDRVLLYAGTKLTDSPSEYLNLVEDRSCIFSGTCPERGTAPSESCGLTCEL